MKYGSNAKHEGSSGLSASIRQVAGKEAIVLVLLLLVTFTLATGASFIVSRMLDAPLAGIVARLIPDELAVAWHRYIVFGLYLVGVNGGVRIWEFEKYVLPLGSAQETLVLTPD